VSGGVLTQAQAAGQVAGAGGLVNGVNQVVSNPNGAPGLVAQSGVANIGYPNNAITSHPPRLHMQPGQCDAHSLA